MHMYTNSYEYNVYMHIHKYRYITSYYSNKVKQLETHHLLDKVLEKHFFEIQKYNPFAKNKEDFKI